MSVIRKLLHGDFLGRHAELLQSGEHLGMHGAPLPSKQVGVHGLTRERMPECGLIVGILHHQLGRNELLLKRQ